MKQDDPSAKWSRLAEWAAQIVRPPPKRTVTEWATDHVIIPHGPSPGPFSVIGREYSRGILDAFADFGLHEGTLVFGSQAGKTTIFLTAMSWIAANSPSPVLFVAPNDLLAKSLSETRWEPLLRASPTLAALIPVGAERHSFKTAQQQLGGSTLNFVGSNSPANLASRPIRILILDEVDKFGLATDREADAVALAEQRTKAFANFQHWSASTPTITTGRIWQSYMSGDMRRYFVPCPHCSKQVLLAWSRQFTLLPVGGSEAWMKWDAEAKKPDGSWDLDRVERSAHCECPFCHGRIETQHKTRMIRGGVWVPTYETRSHRSWHLSSLYVNAVQCSFGSLAVKFLKAKTSPEGLQSFVTGELAEPWESQSERSERVEVVVRGDDLKTPVGEDPVRLLTIDVQARAPYYWFTVREWAKGGGSRLVACGSRNTWEELEQLQADLKVANQHVFVDSGYDSASVYRQCLSRGKFVQNGPGLPVHVGWLPCKGRPKEEGWLEPRTRLPRLWTISNAPLEGGRAKLPLLLFNSDECRNILARLRRGVPGIPWQLTEAADETYRRHLDAFTRRPVVRSRRVVTEWVQRSQRWDDHMLDCELMQVAAALFHKRLRWTWTPPRESEKIELPQA